MQESILSINMVVRVFALIVILASSVGCTATPSLPDPLEAGWRGSSVCERLHEDSGQRILRCTFPPGAGHERHYHVPHFGYTVTGGRMQVTDENGARVVDSVTGSSFTNDGVAWHEVLNVGDTTAVYLILERQR